MTELAGSNQHTAQAFEQAAQQIHITNESVQKIHDAADFITSIANQGISKYLIIFLPTVI